MSRPEVESEELLDDAPSPRMAGVASVALVGIAVAALIAGLLVLSAGKTDAMVMTAAMKRGLLVAVPISLVALLLGAAGRTTVTGRIGLTMSLTLLLASAVLFAWLAFR